jgi:hypothetical protein
MTVDDPLADEPFRCRALKDGRVQIYHRQRLAKTLKGTTAARLLERLKSTDARAAQLVMAKATGQFKFGNERQARDEAGA